MNVAVIIAGGSGQRMGQDIPKQFINVYDKPVLIYTLESFQRNDSDTMQSRLSVSTDGITCYGRMPSSSILQR